MLIRLRVPGLAIIMVLVTCGLVAQTATADEVSIITGRITVNGHPQSNVTVTGFGSSATTGADGQYVLKFGPAGYGTITACYEGYEASSGLIVIPSGPLIRVKDLNIAVEGDMPAGMTDVVERPTVWEHVPMPTGTADAEQAADEEQLLDLSGGIVYMIAALCAAFIGFLIYVTIRK